MDQLARTNALPASAVGDLNSALDRSESQLADGNKDRDLARRLESLAKDVGKDAGDATTTKQRAGLAETLTGIAERLR